jgi:hypothetical protein
VVGSPPPELQAVSTASRTATDAAFAAVTVVRVVRIGAPKR